MCGAQIEPNASNMCVNCIRNQVDITEGIPKSIIIQLCKNCGRSVLFLCPFFFFFFFLETSSCIRKRTSLTYTDSYLSPPNAWVTCELESRELLTFCIKRIKGLNKVKLVDAGFVWTEPHSRRIKVKLTIQKEVFTSTILQQVFVVEFVVQTQQCPACAASFTEHTWQAVVQLRQKVDHKRTFLFLEQLILKHNAHVNTLKYSFPLLLPLCHFFLTLTC